MPEAVPNTEIPEAVVLLAELIPKTTLPVTCALACWYNSIPDQLSFSPAVVEPIVLPVIIFPVSLPVGPTIAMAVWHFVIRGYSESVLLLFADSAISPATGPLDIRAVNVVKFRSIAGNNTVFHRIIGCPVGSPVTGQPHDGTGKIIGTRIDQ